MVRLALAWAVWGTSTATTLSSPPPFLRGADLSSVPQYEGAGIVFKDSGQAKPALAIFRDHGANCVRLRLFVHPTGHGEVVNGLAYTVSLAKQAKALGFLILLDLYYSDTWADPGHQVIPEAWKNLALPELVKQVRDYSAETVKVFAASGAAPDLVQVGNEINNGLLRPLGGFDDQSIPEAQAYDHMADLLKAGIEGVRQSAPGAVIMIHAANGERTERVRHFFGALIERRVPFDMVGLSYYPALGGKLAQLTATMDLIATTYEKPVAIVETAYPYRPVGTKSEKPAFAWPLTPEGQRDYLLDLTKALKSVPHGLGAGFFYWHPDSVRAGSLPLWRQGSMALFDPANEALPALTAFQGP